MAKELPYFKFEPSAWDCGNIQMCSRESKGLFIDLCSLYWNRLGELPYALALQKLCNGIDGALQDLKKHQIIGVIDDNIVIEFLDEQLSDFGSVSEKRRKAANKRWSDASALQLDSKSNAIREEEIREDKMRVKNFTPPQLQELTFYIQEYIADHPNKTFDSTPQKFYDFYESKGWVVGKSKMKDWKACVRTWMKDKEVVKPKTQMY